MLSETGHHKLLILSQPNGVAHKRQLAELEVEYRDFDNHQMASYVRSYFEKWTASVDRSSVLLQLIQATPYSFGYLSHIRA